VDVGSSNGRERHPTCHFVQVIIGCATAEAGCMGSFGSPCFLFLPCAAKYFPEQTVKFFLFSQDFLLFPLETQKEMVYNTGVYA
jgi:hypothetical protein